MFSVKGPKLKIVAGAIALVSVIVGIYLTFFHSRGFVKTTASIIAVEENTDSNGTTYYPTVEYTVGGQTYTAKLNQGSSSYRVGKTISILYDPNDPGTAHGSLGFAIYLLVVGAAILAVLILSTVMTKKSRKQLEEQQALRGGAAYAPSVKGEERELYFLTDTGTAKYGHRIEDKDRHVLYEAKMTKFSVVTPYGFDFIDHVLGRTTPHLVGHEEETEWNSFLLDNNYTFELDGEDIWEHLKRNGVNVETERMEGSIFPRFRISRDGEEIALMESSSQYVHEEDAAAHKIAKNVAFPGFYRIWTREENLDLIFVTALAFARSRALNDEGGTFGKMMRKSLKKQ